MTADELSSNYSAFYLANDGTECPICKSEDIVRTKGIDEETLTSPVECTVCHSEWYEVYKLDGIINLYKGDSPIST